MTKLLILLSVVLFNIIFTVGHILYYKFKLKDKMKKSYTKIYIQHYNPDDTVTVRYIKE